VVSDLVFECALVIAASLWFRLSWIMTPDQPMLHFLSSRRDVFAASGWSFRLAAVVLLPVWVIVAFLGHGFFT